MAFIWRMFTKDSGTKPSNSVIQHDVDPIASWDLVGELGDGAFGKVHKVRGRLGNVNKNKPIQRHLLSCRHRTKRLGSWQR